MQGVDITSVVTVVVALFGGGVVGVVIRALVEKRKLNAEATNTNIKSLLEIDQRMNERMARLEERVASLEQENYKLKTEKLELEKETHELKAVIEKLQEENKFLYEENGLLRAKVKTFEENE